jgi:hypothetical protein
MPNPKRKITIKGREYTLDEAADQFGLDKNLLAVRLHRGWTPEQAVGVHERAGKVGRPPKPSHQPVSTQADGPK